MRINVPKFNQDKTPAKLNLMIVMLVGIIICFNSINSVSSKMFQQDKIDELDKSKSNCYLILKNITKFNFEFPDFKIWFKIFPDFAIMLILIICLIIDFVGLIGAYNESKVIISFVQAWAIFTLILNSLFQSYVFVAFDGTIIATCAQLRLKLEENNDEPGENVPVFQISSRLYAMNT